MQELIKNIENWAEERNLINGSTPQKQFIKLMEEFGELCAGISKNNIDMIKDSIGDCFVVMVILSKQTNTTYKIEPLPLRGYKGINTWIEKIVGKFANIFAKINYNGNHRKYIEYDLGYAMYCLIMIAEEYNLGLYECAHAAYNEIKDRKGKMINGVFVKEKDLGMKND